MKTASRFFLAGMTTCVNQSARGFLIGFASLLAMAPSAFAGSYGGSAPGRPTLSPEKALVVQKQCLTCHQSGTSLEAPRLHGLEHKYLVQQLQLYKTGERKNIFMRKVAHELSDDEIKLAAKYFSDFDICIMPPDGEFMIGDAQRGQGKAAVCVACHIPNSPTGAPMIQGQNGVYLLTQLRNYKSDFRENAIMKGIVAGLADEDFKDLAAYYSAQDACSK